MEFMLESTGPLVIKAVWMADNKLPNSKEASDQRCEVAILSQRSLRVYNGRGPLGFSREFLLEKWFRDAKISDIYEGTGQINRMIVARQILNYSGRDLR